MWVGSSLSSFGKGFSASQAIKCAHSMQCSGWRGIEARVQRGTAARGVCMSSWHSRQDVMVGIMTRAWPLNPVGC